MMEAKCNNCDAVPEWMSCDLLVCKVLQQVSTQIVSECKSFGAQLEHVCLHAIKQLPLADNDGNPTDDCPDACAHFLSAFGALSRAVKELAGDLEKAVSAPLQGVISTVTEESTGRVKHWHYVRNRLAELQDNYGRSRQKSIDARGRLASNTDHKWFRWKQDGTQTATEQHEAVRDLARYEEAIWQGQVSLKRLEEESRERLKQLENEKRMLLRGALNKGASSLRRLLLVADKATEVGDLQEAKLGNEWQGVVPHVDGDTATTESGRCMQEVTFANSLFEAPPSPGARTLDEMVSPPAEVHSPSSDTMKHYRTPSSEVLLDLSDDEPTSSAAVASWTPKPSLRRHSFVFQKHGSSLIAETSISSPWVTSNTLSPNPQMSPRQRSMPASCTPMAFYLEDYSKGVLDETTIRDWQTSDIPALKKESCCDDLWGPSDTPMRDVETLAFMDSVNRIASASPPCKKDIMDQVCLDDETPIDVPKVSLELIPLVAEDPQKCFKRYVPRIPERLATSSEVSWETLQARVAEQPLGGLVGKLECFWICAHGMTASPETVEGLVCFQFVQGFAANFARVLHLSVVGTSAEVESSSVGVGDEWQQVLPSAILEVRRFLFGTLPIDSIRGIVIAIEDENGDMCVDNDVEQAWKKNRFRWFQVHQKLRRIRSVVRRSKMLSSRHLVFHASRTNEDPRTEHTSIGRLPALMLRSGEDAPDDKEDVVDTNFSQW